MDHLRDFPVGDLDIEGELDDIEQRDDPRNELADALVDRAQTGRDYALAHISGYTVGAAVLLEDGTIGTGANIENDNFSCTLHAEQVAYGDALTNRDDVENTPKITHVAVVTSGDDLPEPCGECKQTLTQHAADDMQMILDNSDDREIRDFPHQFTLN